VKRGLGEASVAAGLGSTASAVVRLRLQVAIQDLAVEFDNDTLNFGGVVCKAGIGVVRSLHIRSLVGVPIALSMEVDKRSQAVRTIFDVSGGEGGKSFVLPPFGMHKVTVRAEPSDVSEEVRGQDCVLLVGVGSARLVHEIPLHIRVGPLKYSVEYGDGNCVDNNSVIRLNPAEIGFDCSTPLWFLNHGDVGLSIKALRFSGLMATVNNLSSSKFSVEVPGGSISVSPGEVGRVNVVLRCWETAPTSGPPLRVSISGKLEVYVEHESSPREFQVTGVCGVAMIERPSAIEVELDRVEASRKLIARSALPRAARFPVTVVLTNSGTIPVTVAVPMTGTLRGSSVAARDPELTLYPNQVGRKVSLDLWLSDLDDIDDVLLLRTTSKVTPTLSLPFSVRFKQPVLRLVHQVVDIGSVGRAESRFVAVPLSIDIGAADAAYWVEYNQNPRGPLACVAVLLDGSLLPSAEPGSKPQLIPVAAGASVDNLVVEVKVCSDAALNAGFVVSVGIHTVCGVELTPSGKAEPRLSRQAFFLHGFVGTCPSTVLPVIRPACSPALRSIDSHDFDLSWGISLTSRLLHGTCELVSAVEVSLIPACMLLKSALIDLMEGVPAASVGPAEVHALLTRIQRELESSVLAPAACADTDGLLSHRLAIEKVLEHGPPYHTLARSIMLWTRCLLSRGLQSGSKAVWDSFFVATSTVFSHDTFPHYVGCVCSPLRERLEPASRFSGVFQCGLRLLAFDANPMDLSVENFLQHLSSVGSIAPEASQLRQGSVALARVLQLVLRTEASSIGMHDILRTVLMLPSRKSIMHPVVSTTSIGAAQGANEAASSGVGAGGSDAGASADDGVHVVHVTRHKGDSSMFQESQLSSFLCSPTDATLATSLLLEFAPEISGLISTLKEPGSSFSNVREVLHKSRIVSPSDLAAFGVNFVDIAVEALSEDGSSGWRKLFELFARGRFVGSQSVGRLPGYFSMASSRNKKKRRTACIALLWSVLSATPDTSGLFDTTLLLLRQAVTAKSTAETDFIIANNVLGKDTSRVPRRERDVAVTKACQLAGTLKALIAEGNMESAVVDLAVLATTVDRRLPSSLYQRVRAVTSFASLFFSCLQSSPRASMDCIALANKLLGEVDHRWRLEPMSKFVVALASSRPRAGSGQTINVSTAASLLKVACSEGDPLWATLDSIEQV
jgi:hypothetical protein